MTLVDRAGRNRLVDSLVLTATLGGALLIARSAGVGFAWWAVPFLIVVIFSVRMGCLAVHELGHLSAGRLVGWSWRIFKVGPLLVSREQGSPRVTIDGSRRTGATGQVLFEPLEEHLDFELRRVVMLAGGPLASGGLAWAAWLSWRTIEAPLPQIVVGVTALYSAIVFVTTVLPFESAGNLSDGGAILRELRRRSERRGRHAPEVEI